MPDTREMQNEKRYFSKKLQRAYIGTSEDEWRKRYYNLTKSFRNKHYKNETTLISFVCKIKKETGQIPTLTWSIVRKKIFIEQL